MINSWAIIKYNLEAVGSILGHSNQWKREREEGRKEKEGKGSGGKRRQRQEEKVRRKKDMEYFTVSRTCLLPEKVR